MLLLLSSAFIFPACGSKEVKSQKVPETVLKPSTPVIVPPMVSITATATAVPTPTIANAAASTNTYVKHTSLIKHHIHSHTVKVPIMAAATPLISPVSTPITTLTNFTTENETPHKKSNSNLLLILAGVVLVAALGFYFWTKKAPPHNDFPLPPMGGLSPVGGFTAMRNKVRTETQKKSIWTKKVF